jgi:signal transduction histidine kinase
MDVLTKQILWQSYIILAVIVLIIILLLSNNTKVFEYLSLYKKLREVDRMKDEFISIASHELRAPITGVKGYISMMKDGTFGELPEKLKEPINIVAGAAERLSTLVEDLLNVSRIEQGRLIIDLKPTNINPLVEEVIRELESNAKAKNLAIIFKTPDSLLSEANIDPERFVQVMTNLVSNGIKYTEQGGIEIFTEMKGGKVVVKVKDSGIGMSAKERGLICNKFYRVQNNKTKGIVGTGLGLWFTKNIVEMMRGEITINSIEGFGTQVVIAFPTVKKPSDA